MGAEKSDTAYRTISEVASLLEIQPHVLRFWESKFTQIQPLKRSSNRRFYRPEDVALVTGIKHLLHGQGMTIKGVQKLIKDHGVIHVRQLAGQSAETLAASVPAAASAAPAGLSAAQRRTLSSARQKLQNARDLLAEQDS